MSRRRDKAVSRDIGRAIHQYNMISDGDRIAVALSGGKDSLTLMWALHERLPRIPIDYSILAIYIDLGFDGDPAHLIEAYCKKWVTVSTSSIQTMEDAPTVRKTAKTRVFYALAFEESASLKWQTN